jgi:hypothetical protein
LNKFHVINKGTHEKNPASTLAEEIFAHPGIGEIAGIEATPVVSNVHADRIIADFDPEINCLARIRLVAVFDSVGDCFHRCDDKAESSLGVKLLDLGNAT